MKRKKSCVFSVFSMMIIIFIAASLFVGCSLTSANDLEEPEEVKEEPRQEVSDRVIGDQLIKPEDLEYLGAFRMPRGSNETSWEWGGTAAAYYPGGDPEGPDDGYPGSIFATGHEWEQQVSEISIPVPVISSSKDVNDLNTAVTLQEFSNIRGDLFGYLEVPRVGLEYLLKQGEQLADKLYYCWGQHMQEGDDGPSHGWFDLDLSDPRVQGPWRIDGQVKYVTADYIFAIDEQWASVNTPGKLLATGRFRDGGQGAQGPSLIAYGPWSEGNPPPAGSSLSNIPLLLYSSAYDDIEGIYAVSDYHHSDEWSGGAWLTSGGKTAVIFAGIKGLGDCWYGYYDGTVWPEEPPYPEEGPGERGWWSDDFTARIIFYDPSDLSRVAQGEMEPYQPQPYAAMDIDDVLYNIPEYELRHLGALTFDREDGIIYLFEFRGDNENEKPLVHAWKIQ
jgi:hypothetical protein